jgi:hypothetical protein
MACGPWKTIFGTPKIFQLYSEMKEVFCQLCLTRHSFGYYHEVEHELNQKFKTRVSSTAENSDQQYRKRIHNGEESTSGKKRSKNEK